MSEFHPWGRTRRVEGGLKARSARGAIGETWWSGRFIAVLESFALGSRLTRGRNYARAGQVLSLEVGVGRVSASVQGSRPRPYRVRVELAPFTAEVWSRVEESLAAQALFSARLLAGELPGEIERVFGDAGASLFPAALSELTMSCSCPDSAVPCKHLAATFYLLAEAFDADPFQILYWRGRDRDTLLGRLRALRTGVPHAPGEAPGIARQPVHRVAGAALALDELSDAEADQALDRFWLSPVPLTDRPAVLVTEPDLLVRQLPTPGPKLGGLALADALRRLYQQLR